MNFKNGVIPHVLVLCHPHLLRLLMQVVNILSHYTHLFLFWFQKLNYLCQSKVAFVRLCFHFYLVKVSQPLPSLLRMLSIESICENDLRIYLLSRLLGIDFHLLFSPKTIVSSECWNSTGSWNSSSSQYQYFLLSLSISATFWAPWWLGSNPDSATVMRVFF